MVFHSGWQLHPLVYLTVFFSNKKFKVTSRINKITITLSVFMPSMDTHNLN